VELANKAFEAFERLPQGVKDNLIEEFRTSGATGFPKARAALEDFRKHGAEGALVRTFLGDFLSQKFGLKAPLAIGLFMLVIPGVIIWIWQIMDAYNN
jgi:hypothetical protein